VTELALDFGHEAMEPDPLAGAYRPSAPTDPWLRRRGLTWGSSEIATLLLAYELAPLDAQVPAWMRDGATYYQRLGVPKILAWKAGIRVQPKGRDQATLDRGHRLERRVLSRWQYTRAHELVDPRTIQHADELPRRILPLVDRRCPALAVSPDAWAWGHGRREERDFVVVELKSSRYEEPAEPPWGYVQQLRSQMDAMEAERGVLVVGLLETDFDVPEEKRKLLDVVACEVEPDPEETALRYQVAAEAQALVGRLAALAGAVGYSYLIAGLLRQQRG